MERFQLYRAWNVIDLADLDNRSAQIKYRMPLFGKQCEKTQNIEVRNPSLDRRSTTALLS